MELTGMMQELVDRVTQNIGIDSDIAEKSVGIIFGLLKNEGDNDSVQQLFAAMPGAEQLADNYGGDGGGFLSSLGGGAMAAMGKLTQTGLSMGEIQPLGEEILKFAKEKAGGDLVKQVVGAIPGLGNFV